MHPYATDSNERKLVLFLLAVVSVLSAWFLKRVLGVLEFTIPWWLDAPSVVGFYGMFYIIFDKYLWKMDILRRIGLVKIPDLHGTWEGYITSSFNANAAKYDGTIKICQNWERININMRTQDSKSHSLTAAILTENQNAIIISYEYLNEPMHNAKTTMHAHRGTARLMLASDNQTFEGEYYTGRDRQNFGFLSFSRK